MPVAHNGCPIAVASKVFLAAFVFTVLGRERARCGDRERPRVPTLLPGDVHEAVHHASVLLVRPDLLERSLHLQQQLHPLNGRHHHLGDGGCHAAGQQVLPEGDGVVDGLALWGCHGARPRPGLPLPCPLLPEKHVAGRHLNGSFFLKSHKLMVSGYPGAELPLSSTAARGGQAQQWRHLLLLH